MPQCLDGAFEIAHGNQGRAEFPLGGAEPGTDTQGLLAPANGFAEVAGFGVGFGEFQVKLGLRGLQTLDGLAKARDSALQIGAVADLRDRYIQFIGDLVRIVRRDFTTVTGISGFRPCGKKIARRPAALDVVVRHRHVYSVVGAAAGHVAGGAIASAGNAGTVRFRVALAAGRVVADRCILSARDVVRVVARGARHLTCLEAFRFSQSVGRVGDLEVFVIGR